MSGSASQNFEFGIEEIESAIRLELPEPERYELDELPSYSFELNPRQFVQLFGAGILFSLAARPIHAQENEGGEPGRAAAGVADRLHIGTNGIITVMTTKVEVGQGSRTELTQAVAEELRVPPAQIRLIMGDTQGPNDGMTAGSMTTPKNVPAFRKAAAGARETLIALAAEKWQADRTKLIAKVGIILEGDGASEKSISYAELAKIENLSERLKGEVPSGVELTAIDKFTVLGESLPRVNGAEIVTGKHRYPSDIKLRDTLYGAVLRPVSYGATLKSIDISKAQAMEGVVVVRDGDFIGCVAPTSSQAEKGVEALVNSATWEPVPHPSSKDIFKYLKEHAGPEGEGGRRFSRGAKKESNNTASESPDPATKTIEAAYEIAFVQHAPMEPRAAVAQWDGDKLTVWTGTQMPSRVQSELARAFRISADQVHVIVPDTGGGFGGKHTGEVAVEAARLAKAAGRPVKIRWSREEEFTWAYFRPAGVIEAKAGLDDSGGIVSWDFTNFNSGASALETPYDIPNPRCAFRRCNSPMREGSYRALASTANVFARESFMDELAATAKADPLEFRLKHLKDERLINVLKKAADTFGWGKREKHEGRAYGLACGTEKGSYVAACVEIEVDRKMGKIGVVEICEAFECGKILNPRNLQMQVEGAIIQALGGALREEIRFEDGKVLNPSFGEYRVPRFEDVPNIKAILIDRPDLPSAGAGETPIVATAPAIANAVFSLTGIRLRSMPLRAEALRQA